jgi:hypothetical protein
VEWPLGLSWQSPSVALFQQNRRHVLIRYGSQRRPPTNTNDNDKSWQWVAHRTKINSSDPPLTAVRTAYPTPPFLPFLHPPIELASLRPRGRLDLDGWVHFSAVCFGQVLQLAVGQLCRPDVQDGGVWTRPGNHAESVESRSIRGLVSLTTLLRAVWLTEHTRKSEPGLAGLRCTSGGIQAVVK